MINISARNLELIINGENWTNWIAPDKGILIGDEDYQLGTGLKPIKGTVSLQFSRWDTTLPSIPNALINPNQWWRSRSVSIRVANDSGTLTYLPCSGQQLFILRVPQSPTYDMNGMGELNIEIGCRLALEYFPPEPNKDVSGVIAGTALNRANIISNILNFIGVPNSISSMPYAIDYALPKVEGNWLQMAGAIADNTGYYLRCNVSGTVIAEPILSGSSVASYLIGRDERSWDAIGNVSEQPVEKLIVSGVKQIVDPVADNGIFIEKESLAKTYKYWRTDGRFSDSVVVFRQTANTFNLENPTKFIKKQRIDESFAVTYPALWDGGTLGFRNDLGFKAETITEHYLLNGIPYKIIVLEYESLGYSYKYWKTGGRFSNNRALVRRTTTEWAKTGEQQWTKTVTTDEAKAKTYPDLWDGGTLGFSNEVVTISTPILEKDTSGPPTDFGNASTNKITEKQISATVYAAQLAVDVYRERQHTEKIPYATSEAQLSAYGQLFNRLRSGRAFGRRFGGAITDAALSSFTPFAQISVQEDDLIYNLSLDCVKWGFDLKQAYVAINGIFMGVANAATPTEITYPVKASLGSFELIGLSNSYALYRPIIPDEMIGLSL